jgi:glycosyltransferase involved in cell wall biosynthesis
MISVIIPVYNAEDTIYNALSSIRYQTWGEFEIIIINDGSTDTSFEEIIRFKKNHADLKIMVIDKMHEGVSATRNMGLKIAEGDYIAFLDADDEWHPQKTIKQLAVFNQVSEASFVGCTFKPSLSKNSEHLKKIKSKDLLFKNFFIMSSVLMKRKVFETVGFFEPAKLRGEDHHYFLRTTQSFSCIALNEQLVTYGNGKRGFGQNGLSGNLMKMEISELQNLVYAHKVLKLPLFTCCNAILFSIAKFIRRVIISLPDMITSSSKK